MKSQKLFRFVLCILGSLAGAAIAAGQATPPKTTVLKCGRLLDVRTGKVERDQAILITDNKITSISAAATFKSPAGAETLDLSSATCLPGLMDMHTHLADGGARRDGAFEGPARPLRIGAAEQAMFSIPSLRKTLEAGFTSTRDLGTFRAFTDAALRDAVEAGIVPGPRMKVAGAYVTISGGAGALTGFAPDIQLPLELRYGQADGPDQVRQRVREIIRHGADVIKVLSTGAILTLHSQPGSQEFTYEELRAAVEEATKAGLKVACHAHSPAGAKDAIRAGVASIEHGTMLDEEALQMMKDRGTFLVPDPIPSWTFWPGGTPEGRRPGYPQEYVDKEKRALETHGKVVKRAAELGVKMALGTDAAVIPHGQNAKIFAIYVGIGLTPLHAIQMSTVNAAELIGWADRLGAIETGKLADIIAVRENPLENIRTLETVAFVMKDGKVYKNELHP
ncbi:MAG: amidohydrolase family protein [Acidobacteria bacterium]|nr:amidohydrolase family protein [Acidobacteriota bacterium]